MLFSEVIGQTEIKEKILQAVKEERISHAQMFTGEEGFGILPLALAFAQYVLCENRNDNDSCGTCSSCVKVQKLIHPDLHLVFPVTTTNSNKKPKSDDFVAEWREAVLKQPYLSAAQWYRYLGNENKQGMIYSHESEEILRKLNLKTFEAEYKVMIIWQVERMNLRCANKLLKILEEPPPKTLFLIISVFPDQLLPTMLSRVQTIRIPALNDEEIYTVLENDFELSEKERRNITRLSSGNYIKALEYIQSSDEQNEYLDLFIKWMRLCYKQEMAEILSWVDEISASGREKIKQFLNYAIRMTRENFLLSQLPEQKDRLIRMGEEENEFSGKFSKFINEKNIFELSGEINLAILDVEANAYQKTVLFDLSIKTMKLIRK